MAQRLDKILVVDVESTCWDDPPQPGQESEIIEIGLCVLAVTSLQALEKRSILVRPERSTVSPFCTALTTLTQADVDAGLSLEAACRILEEDYKGKQRLWASYGDYDRRQLEAECRDKGVSYPFGPGHLNVKTLLAITCALPREVGLSQALERLGLPLEGTHHRGVDDAWNIAQILSALLQRGRQKSVESV